MEVDPTPSDATKASKVQCFFDITIADIAIGRIVFELWKDKVPKTAENFRCLCTGERGKTSSGAQLTYEGTLMHRVIKGFMIQGGDFTKFNGTGGESIYGGRFEDEDLTGLHDRPGLLSMANAGKNTNGSQFFITCAAAPHLNGNHVVFGRVLTGKSVLRMIEREPVSDEKTHRPGLDIKVAKCGELSEKDWVTADEFEDLKQTQNKKRKKRRSSSSSSSSSSEDSADSSRRHKRRGSPSKKRSKYSEKDELRKSDERTEKHPSEPPQPRLDAKGRTVKGRGTVSEKRFEHHDRRGASRDVRQDRRPARDSDRRDYRDSRPRDYPPRRRYEDDDGRWERGREERRPGEELSRHRDASSSSHRRIEFDNGHDGMPYSHRGNGDTDKDDRAQSRSLTSPPSSPRGSDDPSSSLLARNGDQKSKNGGYEADLPQRKLVSYSGVVEPPALSGPASTSTSRSSHSRRGVSALSSTHEETKRSPDVVAQRQRSPQISPHASDSE